MIVQRSGSDRSGFTLIEMLVVISVIAILIAILLPALNLARDSAQAVACMSNQRQIGVAAGNYAAEWRMHVPVSFEVDQSFYDQAGMAMRPDWRVTLSAYTFGPGEDADAVDPQALYDSGIAPVFDCPKGQFPITRAVEGGVPGGEWSKNRGTYGVVIQPSVSHPAAAGTSWPSSGGWSYPMNDYWSMQPGRDWTDPTNSVYIADAYRAINLPGPDYPSVEESGTNHLWPPHHWAYYVNPVLTRRFAARHGKGTHVLFLDGRVERRDTEALDNMAHQAPDNIWDVY